MFCPIMFSVLDTLVYRVSAWCSSRSSTFTQCAILVFFIMIVYLLVLRLGRASIWLCNNFESRTFKELYRSVEENDMIKCISILDRNPKYVNKFKHPEGYTPFMVACANANTQLVKYMLQKGANVKMKSESNETPFYLAAFYYIQNKNCKNASCIRELYYAGADINEPGKNNMTVLQLAAIFGHTPLIKWLMVKNANLKQCPHPYLLAKSQGHQEAADLIERSMKIRSIQFK